MAQPEYGRDKIVTVTRRHGIRMKRVLRIACLCVTAPLANELRLDDKPVRNTETVWGAIIGAVCLVVAGVGFPLKTTFKIFAMPFGWLLEWPLSATAAPDFLPALNTQPRQPDGRGD